MALACALAVVVTIGAGTKEQVPDEIRAKRFVTIDEAAESRVVIDGDGVSIDDVKSKASASLCANNSGSGLILRNEVGKSMLHMDVVAGRAWLKMGSPDGKPVAALSDGHLTLTPADKPVWSAP